MPRGSGHGRGVPSVREKGKAMNRKDEKVTLETAVRELAHDFGCRVIIDDPEYGGFSVSPEGRITPLKGREQ